MKNKKLWLLTGASLLLTSPLFAALNPNTSYQACLLSVNASGAKEEVKCQSFTTDGNGLAADIEITNVPVTTDGTYLIYIKNSAGNIVRKSLVTPPQSQGDNVNVGITELSTSQTTVLEKGFTDGSTNDPIFAAFALMTVKIKDASTTALDLVATTVLEAIITGDGSSRKSFTQYMVQELGEAKVAEFRSALKTLLKEFNAKFKQAAEETTEANQIKKMGLAGGLIADIFIRAAEETGIDLNVIPEALDAAGRIAEANTEWQNVESTFPKVAKTVNNSISSFSTRINVAALSHRYSTALSALNASDAQVNRYQAALTTLGNAINTIDEQIAEASYNPSNASAIDTEFTLIDQAFSTAFNTFNSNVAATSSELDALKSAMAQALSMTVSEFNNEAGDDFGKIHDNLNWPITQVVSMHFLASLINNGGTLTYERDTTVLPTLRSGEPSFNQSQQRTDFQPSPGDNAAIQLFLKFLGLEEDVRIIEYMRGIEDDREEQDSNVVTKTFRTRLANRIAAISGTVDSNGTALTDAQKKALITLSIFPHI